MSSPIIHLRSREASQEHQTTSEIHPLEKNSVYSPRVAGLLALFAAVIASSLIIMQSAGGSTYADAEPVSDTNAASLSGITFENDSVLEEPADVDVVLFQDPFENVYIQGRAAYVLDYNTGKVLYEKNSDEKLPLASITKVMTALVAAETSDEKSVVTIKDSDLQFEGFSGLVGGEDWILSDLLDFMLITSSNDGASAIASAAGTHLSVFASTSDEYKSTKDFFVEEMNKKAEEIGMSSSEFHNESGLDITNQLSGGHGTARDIGTLYSYILENHPTLLDATRYSRQEFVSLNSIRHEAKNTNQEVERMAGIIGSKTGYTDLAGGNLAIVYDSGIGTPVIVVVLGSTIDGRFSDVMKLSDIATEYISLGAVK